MSFLTASQMLKNIASKIDEKKLIMTTNDVNIKY